MQNQNPCNFAFICNNDSLIVGSAQIPMEVFSKLKTDQNSEVHPKRVLICRDNDNPGALRQMIDSLCQNYHPSNIRISQNTTLAEVLGIPSTSERAKKAQQKKKAVVRQGPKAAKASKNLSEKVRVSK